MSQSHEGPGGETPGPPGNPSRPPFLDIGVVVAIVLLVGGLIGLALGRDADPEARPAVSATPTPTGPVVHSSTGALPTATAGPVLPTGSASAGFAAPSAPPPAQQSAIPGASELASAAQQAARTPTSFRVATFNVLGAGHTRKHGDSRIKRPYTVRLPAAVRLLEHHDVDVVGFQEFEPVQRTLFDRLTGARWDRFPAAGNDAVSGSQAIAWRTDVWEYVDGTAVDVPYFHGRIVHTPALLLRHLATHRTVWFLNVHNAASGCAVCGGNNDRWRNEALRREIAAIERLGADGTPVVFTGDMNSSREFFCTLSAALPVRFANGGSHAGGRCLPPTPTPIDWIVGTRQVSFTGYVRDRGPLAKYASDHAIYAATAMVP